MCATPLLELLLWLTLSLDYLSFKSTFLKIFDDPHSFNGALTCLAAHRPNKQRNKKMVSARVRVIKPIYITGYLYVYIGQWSLPK